MASLALILLLPVLLVTALATILRQRTARALAGERLQVDLDAGAVVERCLQAEGLARLRLELRPGVRAGLRVKQRALALRPEVMGSRNLLELGEALHELGHALQVVEQQPGILPRLAARNWLRTAPLWLGLVAALLGLRFQMVPLATVLFAGGWALCLLSNLAALPLELDASARGRQAAVKLGLVRGRVELARLKQATTAAALAELAGFGGWRGLLASWSLRGDKDRARAGVGERGGRGKGGRG